MTARPSIIALVILACGSVICLLSLGLRSTFGLYMGPISSDLGWGREIFSFAIALQSLVWGVTTPIFGYLSDRYGPGKVVAAGGVFYALGLLMMAWANDPLDATLGIGVLTGFAMAMTGFPIVLSVIGRKFPPQTRSFYLGIASALGSSGQLVLVPLDQVFITAAGWEMSFIYLAIIAGVMVPLAAAMAGGNAQAADEHSEQTFKDAIREAAAHKGFRLLSIGYFVCGAQAFFITAHLPAYLVDLGHPLWLGSLSLALIGGFNIIGSTLWGKFGNTYSKKNLLCLLYAGRSVCMMYFVLTPITPTSVIIFSSAIGLMWLGTVPLTSALVAQVFGTKYMATLVGFTFVSHQIGSFLGIYLGGLIFDLYGTYDPIFWGAIIVGFAASLVHYPIDERPVARMRLTAQAAQ
jgi:MFS family permease